jgi:hypothetical protein
MIVQRTSNAHATSFAPLFVDWAHSIATLPECRVFRPALRILDGIPPPREGPSLLSLHCALTL